MENALYKIHFGGYFVNLFTIAPTSTPSTPVAAALPVLPAISPMIQSPKATSQILPGIVKIKCYPFLKVPVKMIKVCTIRRMVHYQNIGEFPQHFRF